MQTSTIQDLLHLRHDGWAITRISAREGIFYWVLHRGASMLTREVPLPVGWVAPLTD